MFFHTLIFDLDDTLFDTYGQLVGPATREFCRAMVAGGLNATENDAVAKKEELFARDPRGNYFAGLVDTFGIRPDSPLSPGELEALGRRAYLDRQVEPWIQPFSTTVPTLTYLRQRYRLFLVTSGVPGTQKQKMHHLGLLPYFNSIHYLDSTRGESKHQAFREILAREELQADGVLSIGDRVDREIRDANRLGMRSCHLQRGEFAHLLPTEDSEHPHFQITCLGRLIETCVL